jgi:hypothetical protein
VKEKANREERRKRETTSRTVPLHKKIFEQSHGPENVERASELILHIELSLINSIVYSKERRKEEVKEKGQTYNHGYRSDTSDVRRLWHDECWCPGK